MIEFIKKNKKIIISSTIFTGINSNIYCGGCKETSGKNDKNKTTTTTSTSSSTTNTETDKKDETFNYSDVELKNKAADVIKKRADELDSDIYIVDVVDADIRLWIDDTTDQVINNPALAIEYQKENGLLWAEVAQVMQGTPQEITAFIAQYTPSYRSNSELQIAEDLRKLHRRENKSDSEPK